VRALLLFLANSEGFKNFLLRFKIFRKTAWRFVAGETLDDAIEAVREANRRGLTASLDLLGENTKTRQDASNATREVLEMLDRIEEEKVDSSISVKLTQLGLGLDVEFCRQNLLRISKHARDLQRFVRVDMEDSSFTQKTLDCVFQVRSETENIGAVIQSYLYRSEEDIRNLLQRNIPVRLCKGAYLEPENIAFKKKRDNDANFVKLMKLLLEDRHYHAIATHDEAMIQATEDYAKTRNIAPERFEFQMLYGVRRDLQEGLKRKGYNVRIYIPYGRSWYPYFMRRLAERPANMFFIARNILRG
jgi:proline dehydrogenase